MPLATHDALQMHNCVDSWHHRCTQGLTVVFRMAGTLGSGARVRATVGFQRVGGQSPWQLDQILKRGNDRVSAELKAIAHDAERDFNARAHSDDEPSALA